MRAKGIPNVKSRRVTDDFGVSRVYRRCHRCQSWLEQRIGNFTPRRRDAETRRVERWDSYCLPCRAEKNRGYVQRKSRGERRRMSRAAWERTKADPVALEESRRRGRETQRKAREREPERVKQARRASYARMKADPVWYARYLEARRMQHRLRQERRGTPVTRVMSKVVMPPDRGSAPRRPAGPLLEAVRSYARRNELSLQAAAGDLGITDRTMRRWQSVPDATAQAQLVDRVLTALALNPQDVWDA